MRLFKSIAALFSSSLGSQLIVVLMMPVLARYYPASAFGDWALFVALSSTLAVVSSFRYDHSILLPANPHYALKLVKSAIVISFSTSCIAMMVVAGLYASGVVENEIYLFAPISMFFIGLIQIATTWLNRRKSYKLIAWAKLMQSLCTAVLNVLFVGFIVHDFSVETLVVATMIGQFVGLTWLVWPAIKRIRKTFSLFSRVQLNKKVLFMYSDFPLYSTPEALLGMISTMFPLYATAYFFTSQEAGYVALAHRVLMLPAALIGGAVSVVYAQRFSAMVARNLPISVDMFKVWSIAAVIGLVPALILNMFGEQLFMLAFGEQWLISGEIASSLAIYVYLLFVFGLTSGAHVALRLQHMSLIFAIMALAAKCIVLYLLQENLIGMMIGLAAIDFVATLTMNLLALFKSEKIKNEIVNVA